MIPVGARELRPVPVGWEHPREGDKYVQLHSRARLARWRRFYGDHPEYAREWYYDPDEYMPEIPEGTPLGWQLYETTTEGTPVSPVFTSLEDLAAWCETGATVWAGERQSKDAWLASFRSEARDLDGLGAVGRT